MDGCSVMSVGHSRSFVDLASCFIYRTVVGIGMVGRLFYPRDLSSFLDDRMRRIQQNIQAGKWDSDIRKNPKGAGETLYGKYKMGQVSISRNDSILNPANPGDMMKVSVYATFEGDSRLLEYHPSGYRDAWVPGTVKGDRIVTELTGRPGVDDLKRMRERWWGDLEYHANSANKDADRYNGQLSARLDMMIAERVKQIRKSDDEMDRMST